MESLYLLILVLIIILIIFPFTFNSTFFYNLNLNLGTFSLKVGFITLKKADIKRVGRDIVLIEKKKNKELEIKINKEQIRFLKTFFIEVKNKFKIRKIEINSEAGAGNPFNSALFSGVYSGIVLSLFSRLKIKQPTASFELKNNTNFFDFMFKIKIFLRGSISIFDILYSLIISVLRNKKDKMLEGKLKKI